MEESAVQTSEEKEARDSVSLSLARARKMALEGPSEEDVNRPPHLQGR